MDKVAALPPEKRKELFQEAAANRGFREAIVEKDFWVCWTLKKLFSDPVLKSHLVFKGGTSLSKVFNVIHRFSEDIDLILDWSTLGYGSTGEVPTEALASKTKLNQFNDAINEKAVQYIRGPFLERLGLAFASVAEVSASVDADDPHCVNVRYPATFISNYLLPQVRLEIGPLASWIPSSPHTVRPYASEDFPQVFEDPTCPVVAIAAERTFWEKVTILHKEAYREAVIPSRYSRHYYDLYMLSKSDIKAKAFSDDKLLADVVEFKIRHYPSAWARYDLARPPSIKLIPSGENLIELEKDYGRMADMFFATPPTFRSVVDGLRSLEREINQIGR